MTRLIDTFASLRPPAEEAVVVVRDIPGHPECRLGRLFDGSPALIFVHGEEPANEAYGLRLRHVEYLPCVSADLSSEPGFVPALVAILACRDPDVDLLTLLLPDSRRLAQRTRRRCKL